jgi:hypothetical protein
MNSEVRQPTEPKGLAAPSGAAAGMTSSPQIGMPSIEREDANASDPGAADGSATLETTQASPCEVGQRGLSCRHCGCNRFRVIYTRSRRRKIMRRRACTVCKQRITTWEQAIGCGT